MFNKYQLYLSAFVGSLLMVSCGNDKKPEAKVVTPKKPVVMVPFRFHKLVEVSPGQDYDVLSWGRGATKTGAFEILHSDSVAAKFTTTTGDLVGDIVDAYNSDMDLDGNPEIIIQAKGKDTINYTNMYAFEFNNSGAHKLEFPRLNKSQRAGYRGDDNFYIKDGKLIREFPIYDGNTKVAKPTGAKRQFEYDLHGLELSIKQLTKDSTNVKGVQKEPVKASTSDNKTSTTKKSKKNTEEHHKKKKRRHHREE
ncbi:hypothetical protein KXD93_22815 [Mucilaginibacter sp. BJC16-A38]|uniref:hypothetical protein n=1 Tax=Mucilaginibacter phenanthrenivorans TaxID=1234842 RepID=UPI002157D8C1|nr:hypothetical protein [Mucilaginibacter phenanthrenivorans]MCR8560504.1 hypothetical protein [Mucilaginibacter phenanthrenivorans]